VPTPAKPAPSTRIRVVRVKDGAFSEDDDILAGEEPLEIRLLWQAGRESRARSIAVTMRTPGDDLALAAGFLYGESLLAARADVADIAYCLDEDEEQAMNIVTVTLRPGLEFDEARLERNFYTTSSCGVCGKASIEAVEVQGCHSLPDGPQVSAGVLGGLPAALRAAQTVFDQTGGLHAAGLFDLEGRLLLLKEDVGRHNAVDKLIGQCFLDETLPLHARILLLSGRASFELLQKAVVARIPIVAAVGAPSSLAVDLARNFNVTLAGFVRPSSLNVYAGSDRLRA
jgi:FdhD protein